MESPVAAAGNIYESLWQQAVPALQNGTPQLDPQLLPGAADARRGVTLIARPTPEIQERVAAFLQAAQAVAPGQHVYSREELHVTLLAVIPGSEQWQQSEPQLPQYQTVLAEVLSRHKPFTLSFRGVTASPQAVLIQGFPEDDSLARLRDDLRAAFAKAGLGQNLDRRYKIGAAHLTALRFARPLPDWNPLLRVLEAHRQTVFGEMEVRAAQLIWSNWYASANLVHLLATYPLG